MQTNVQKKRASKRLLVATIGVAAVSYMASACAPDDGATEDEASEQGIDDEAASDEVAGTQQALTGTITLGTALPKLPPSGNLMPPDIYRPKLNIDLAKVVIPQPSGNLMATPIDQVVVQTQIGAAVAAGAVGR